MKGAIIYSTYRIIDNKPVVCLFGRLENGETFLAMNGYKPYFYIKETDLNEAKKVSKKLDFETRYEKTAMKNFAGEGVAKVIAGLPKYVPLARQAFEDKGIICYEADIKFAERFLIDNNLLSLIEIEGDYESLEGIDRLYKNAELKDGGKEIDKAQLNIISLDIETDSKGRIIAVAMAGNRAKEIIICANIKKRFDNVNVTACRNERELLENFCIKIKEIDPDIITGWSLVDFDLKVIKERAKKNNIIFAIGRTNEECKISISRSFFRESRADLRGRVALDGISLLRKAFIKLDDYKLDAAAKKLLKDGKIEIDKDNFDELIKKEPERILEYNLKDALLAYRIVAETGALELALQKSVITGLQADEVKPIASLDSLYIREARKRGIVCPTRVIDSKLERIKGGYVMESKPGLYENIIVLDFKSLYPSIIRTFNIDPYSFAGVRKKKGQFIMAPNNACFRNEHGIMPAIIQNLWEWREKAGKEKNEVARYAIKILMNSFFGSLASPACRFFNLDIANSITNFGQFIVKETASKIQGMGYEVIYMDTDSVFVKAGRKDAEEANKTGMDICRDINNYYKEFVNKSYQRESFLELQLSKVFKRFLMPRLRLKEQGAKKRYAGLTDENKLVIVGLEAIRSDWTDCARIFQKELLIRIFNNKDYRKFILEFIENLKCGKIDSLLIYRKSIRKGLSEYTKTTPPHVKAARKCMQLNGNLVEYVLTKEGPEPIDNIKNKLDYEHYIKKQIKPIADSILCFLNTSFDLILSGQKRLG